MRINPIKTTITPAFKQNSTQYPVVELETTGYDDSSQALRDYIRVHLSQMLLLGIRVPTTVFKNETDNYAEILTNKPLIVDYKTMHTIPATNIHSIGNNSYRGGYLPDNESVQTAKKAGIKCVIDLTESSEYKRRIEKNGLKYISYNTDDNNNTIGEWDSLALFDYYTVTHRIYNRFYRSEEEFNKECRESIENFAKLIGQLNEGYCYIGCSSGTHRTSFVMTLNDAFNPKKQACRLDNPKDISLLLICKNLYSKLTDEDKRTMGWDKEFERLFLTKLENGFKRYKERYQDDD